ncbi:hypothetical protein [Terasakiella pusilla]|jgi:prophage DNA circulation protein|uniref:hypothetical protein n=1 Tax=Terasakiella pusilla TaxID=64973 RepID=UPI00048B9485|nr:hypothetical protein [Terasakiella pusilla]
MLTLKKTLLASAVVSSLALAGVMTPLAVQAANDQAQQEVTLKEIRSETAEAFDKMADYTVEKRDEALKEASEALTAVDQDIATFEKDVRANWDAMSEEARAAKADALKEIKEKRYQLSVKYDALKDGADDTWDDMVKGFSDAWQELASVWTENSQPSEKMKTN